MAVFETDPTPHDIKQGMLGDCWLLSAISTLAERSEVARKLRDLFVTKEYNEEGFYQLKIYKNGQWIQVNIDDYFPCTVNGGPIFTSSNNGLWVMLLEKAYAKIHGSYYALRSGRAYEAMVDLTGFPIANYKFEDAKV